MQVASVMPSAVKLYQSSISHLKQSVGETPVEAARLQLQSAQESAIASKLLQVADENDRRLIDMVA
ncbi:MAG TPA: hypothetical protein DCO70_00650 [Verrucomicrobiales bacterium]|jgi:hypothetical protein|nr:hypothetical protein [Verrucomicrobiales bacterium]MEC9081964.1 hypothetical protein [Verrucomicrobiota bacterium]MED6313814.1 hypothetical protein [Verrucomicrobiota bacterium]HAH97811.1 hypothetical protein [Verrucomicrobiales bacterium]|tara:strand:- start:1272 stop:1469 length:198 start_codon:yes stop_codon:yes gene_type:complete